jgi:hypothetical protein
MWFPFIAYCIQKYAESTADRITNIKSLWHSVLWLQGLCQQNLETLWLSRKILSLRHNHTYSVLGFDGREVTLNYPHLWRRIENEFVRLHLSQELANLNAGQTLSSHGIVVSQQGIANQPGAIRSSGMVVPNSDRSWHLPWQAITGIRVKRATIELEGPGLTYKRE